MRILKHTNTHFPDKLIYKCTIGYNTKFGSLEDVTEWRDDHVVNADYYAKLSESILKRQVNSTRNYRTKVTKKTGDSTNL